MVQSHERSGSNVCHGLLKPTLSLECDQHMCLPRQAAGTNMDSAQIWHRPTLGQGQTSSRVNFYVQQGNSCHFCHHTGRAAILFLHAYHMWRSEAQIKGSGNNLCSSRVSHRQSFESGPSLTWVGSSFFPRCSHETALWPVANANQIGDYDVSPS